MSPRKPAAGAAGGPARRRRSPASFFLAGPWEGRICVFRSRRYAIAGRAQDLAGWHIALSGDASTPPATETEPSRLPSNRPDPKADHDTGPSPSAGYVGVCY